MTITAFPFENIDTSEAQYSRLFRELQDSGIAADISSLAFKVTANGANLQLTVAPGFAIVRGHAVESTANETLDLDPATAAPRIDRIVLRLDPSANTILPTILKGSPQANPVAPALMQTDTGTYDLPLAQVLIPAAALAVGQGAVTDERRYLGVAITAWTTNMRPPSPRKSTLGLNVNLGFYEFWDGVEWKPLIDSSNLLSKTGKAADSDKLDGLDSSDFWRSNIPFARKDQAQTFANTLTAAGVYDGTNRVYSAANPPPPGGSVIVKTVRGTLTVPANGGTQLHSATIPAVVMAKAQVRLLGAYRPGVIEQPVTSYIRLSSSTSLAFSSDKDYTEISYEITEWS